MTPAWKHAMRPLCRALFGEHDWTWPAEARDPEALAKLAADRLTQLPLTGVA